MAQKRTIDIDINTNADQAAKEFDDLGKATQRAANSVDNLDATFEEVYGELQPLTTRMGEAEDRLYELALAGDTASKEYQELLTKVGQYRKVQIETDLAVDGAATTLSQKLGSALTGVTSGFAATQGAIALFGKENEALEKTLVKVQAALAIQQGVDGLRTSYKELGGITGLVTKAQKALNVVLKANPFVLITAGIVAAVAALAKFTSFLDPAIDKLKEFTDFIGLTDFAEEERSQARKRRAEEQKARQEQELAREKAIKNFKQQAFDDEIAINEALGKSTFKLQQQKLADLGKEKLAKLELMKLDIERTQQRIKEGGFSTKVNKEILAEQKNAALALAAELKSVTTQLTVNEINENKKQVESAKATNAEKLNSYNEYAAKRKAAARQIEDLQIQLMEDGLEKELLINKQRFDRQREDITATGQQRLDLIDLFNQLELQKEKEIRDELDVFKLESFDGELAQMELVSAKQIETTKLTNEEIENQIKGSAKRQKEIDDKTTADKLANQKLVAETSLQLAHESLGAIGELANAFAKDDEKSAEKAFKINKAVGIAQAVVSTAQGIMAQLAVPQDALTGVNFVKAGIVAATGAAQIATISKSKFQGGTNDTPDIDTSGGGQAQAPSFNVVGDSGVNQLAQIQQQPVQAFVVSGEVTTSQALDRNRVQNATL